MGRRMQAATVSFSALLTLPSVSLGLELPKEHSTGVLEVVALFEGPMPSGVAVSDNSRIFISFPRWGDAVAYTVAEVKDGKTLPYPTASINTEASGDAQADHLVSVQSVVVDPSGHTLWILDTGSIAFGPVKTGGPKLLAIDLNTDQIIKKIAFPPDVALPTSYLNDVRFDLRRGGAGMAFITDSTFTGPNGIIVVDLHSGQSWRRLSDHPSTKADLQCLLVAEGQALALRPPHQKPARLAVGSDGIAISPDGKTLYYSPLSSRHLYSVSVDALVDRQRSAPDVALTVKDLGEKGGAGDGLESDAQGRIYLTDYEHNAIRRMDVSGEIETLVHDPRALWPDTLSLAADGYLYFIANQLHRQSLFQSGQDLRQKPYVLFRTKVDGAKIKWSAEDARKVE